MTDIVDRLRSRNGSTVGFGIGPVCDEAADLITRLRAELAALQWQPIETAPKEWVAYGKPDEGDFWLDWCLLGCFDKHGFVCWVGGMDAGMWLERGSDRACGDSRVPTHWMPLPPAPAIDAEMAKDSTHAAYMAASNALGQEL